MADTDLRDCTTEELAKALEVRLMRDNTLYGFTSHGIGHVHALAKAATLEEWMKAWAVGQGK